MTTFTGGTRLTARFLVANWPLLFFGWLMTFCSAFGQTYFISVFGGELRSDLAIDHTTYGSSYSAGTIASAFVLLWAGRLIDRIDLRLYAMAAVVGLAAATVGMSFVGGVAGLTLAFFALRFFGQGLMSHTAMTTMGRSFAADRGRAVSFALTGHVAGGAVLPIAGAAVIGSIGWRSAWLLGACLLLLVTAPLVVFLLGRRDRPAAATSPAPSSATRPAIESEDWSLSEILREPGLYPRLGILLAPAFITTGLIFHQVKLGDQKGWDLSLIATGLACYALGSFVMTLVAGPLIDRWSARRLIPLGLVPLAVGCGLLTVVASPLGAYLYFGFIGFGTGFSQVLNGAAWAELYGSRHLGAIRSFTASCTVFSSGLAPGLVGLLIDRHWSVEQIAASFLVYCIAASLLALAFVAPPRKSSSSAAPGATSQLARRDERGYPFLMPDTEAARQKPRPAKSGGSECLQG